MNIFEACTIVAVPSLAVAGGYYGATKGPLWMAVGAIAGGASGVVVGPLAGFAFIFLAHALIVLLRPFERKKGTGYTARRRRPGGRVTTLATRYSAASLTPWLVHPNCGFR